MSKSYLMIGSYIPETEDQEAVIDREYYRQGWIFKDEKPSSTTRSGYAMCRSFPMQPIPGRDFLAMCNGAGRICRRVFRCGGLAGPGNMD